MTETQRNWFALVGVGTVFWFLFGTEMGAYVVFAGLAYALVRYVVKDGVDL